MISEKQHTSGQVLIFSLIFMLIVLALSGVLIATTFSYARNGALAYAQERAIQIAEGGIDKALYQLNQSGGASYTGEADTTLGDGEFTVMISDVGQKRIIESTGYVPNNISPAAQRTVRVELSKTSSGVSFIYGVQVGYGGLVMNNNAAITGSVYSNGNITGAQNTQLTGDAWVAGGLASSPDQQQPVQTADQNIGDVAAETDGAQSFVAGTTQTISVVSIYVRRVGSPSNATVHIVTDNADNPSGTSIAQGTLNSGSVGTTYGWIDVSLTTNPQLMSGQKYWIVIDVPSPRATRYYVWGKHTNSGYGNGVGKYVDDWSAAAPAWSDANGDFAFKTWMGNGITKIVSMSIGADAHANTIESSTISRDAYYQTISGSTVGGTSNPGSADPPVIAPPVSDAVIADFEAAAEAGGVITPPTGTYTISGIADLGPVKIEGNLDIALGAIITLKGPVWVEGDITLNNNCQLNLDSAFGSDSTMIVADYKADPFSKGIISITNNAQINGSGTAGSYIMVLSTYANPIGNAIDVNNNTQGAIFYSSAGNINVNNNVALKEVIGYKLTLANNASVTYESGLSNVNFSTGPGGGWTLKRGSWVVVP
ncbi:MAG TPA: hypothetical protein VJK50_01110 [Patescibacteria group bacterium]|nr:hypothetical protein [Patescibacteria group bacterium]